MTLDDDERRQAFRAYKGAVLRQEVYAEDGTEQSDRPYSTSERTYAVELLQPRGDNAHAVFSLRPRETLDVRFERVLDPDTRRADPRVTHAITLACDEFGNVLRSAAVAYGRRTDDPDPALDQSDRTAQRRTLVTCTDSDYTAAVTTEPDHYRGPQPWQTRTYEVLPPDPIGQVAGVTNLFGFDELQTALDAAAGNEVPYDVVAADVPAARPARRLIDATRSRYRRQDLTGPLLFGESDTMALPWERYTLALTPGLIDRVFIASGKIPAAEVRGVRDECGYVDLDNDGRWWTPSGPDALYGGGCSRRRRICGGRERVFPAGAIHRPVR